MSFCIFNRKQWTTSSIPKLSGRVTIVTGGNTGLGYITVCELARKGARVYMFSRAETRALAAIEKIKGELGPHLNPEIEYINFDLLRLKSASEAAEEFMWREKRLDILMALPYELSPEGIEIQACNGTGHFALTVSLLSLLKETAAMPDSHVRIVNISSITYLGARAGKPDFSSLEGLNQKTCTTILQNILLTNELQKHLAESGITNICCLLVHPGVVVTELIRSSLQSWPLLAPLAPIIRMFSITPEQGALTQLYAATSPEVEEKDLKAALLFLFAQPRTKSSLTEDKYDKLGSDFWALCEALMRQKA
ncbi:short chain dehydrogenase [Lentinula aciculospora]|uniref:Short chain dehydrogenase n=1 Tax=Lentinula aciculospora TaxID=153920 RepID=A0A9W9AIZ9_9AGAR|nr:short chain dehydrogenase [Lentinula aciculospora]